MAEYTPTTIPLGSLAEAAAAGADLAQQEQQLYGGPDITTGENAPPQVDWG